MLETPGFVLAASAADTDSIHWAIEPPLHGPFDDSESMCSRIARLIEYYRKSCPVAHRPPACRIEIRRTIPAHQGLGCGTQLGLAVAQSLLLLSSEPSCDARVLAARVRRGRRSAIGIHGFARGGFLIDGGKQEETKLAPLIARAEIPVDWRFLLIAPPESATSRGLSGQAEVDALKRLPPMPLAVTERLCRVALMEMLPALVETDIERFGEAMFQFNHAVGCYFEPVQGGDYASADMAQLVNLIRLQGTRGVAQTSWGPTIAALCADAAHAESLRRRILDDSRWSGCHTQIARPRNVGADIQIHPNSASTARIHERPA
jgi:beta-RFAP synthase